MTPESLDYYRQRELKEMLDRHRSRLANIPGLPDVDREIMESVLKEVFQSVLGEPLNWLAPPEIARPQPLAPKPKPPPDQDGTQL